MESKIETWQQFGKEVRTSQSRLLSSVKGQQKIIFIAGCQRSGTTILTNVLMQSTEIEPYKTNLDSELEGALMLCGRLPMPETARRYCCQTTYLNEKFGEYFENKGCFKLVFVVRNPFSVVYSMVYHWKRRIELRNFALNELFVACGSKELSTREQRIFSVFGAWGFSSFKKACLSYVNKTAQLFEIKERLGDNLLVVDYDDLINNRHELIPSVFSFLEVPYSAKYAEIIHTKSIKRADRLSDRQRQIISEVCCGTYEKAKKLITLRSG